jgi:putative acetyltransferase
MGLAPVAVLPEYQRKGIGGTLIREGIGLLQVRGCPFIIVLGHPAYYPHFGFTPASQYGIRCEWDVPDGAFMIRLLDPEVMADVSGLAKYRPEFHELT